VHAASEVIVIGGANVDIKAKAQGELLSGTSNPGRVAIASGGVARNIAHNLARLDVPVALISAVGSDTFGRTLIAETEAAGVDCAMVLTTSKPTGSYIAVLDTKGELAMGVNDMSVIDEVTPGVLSAHEHRLQSARLILADCNLPEESLHWLAQFAGKLIVEPVSVAKSEKVRVLAGVETFGLTLNRRQAEHLSGVEAFDAIAVLHERGFEHVVLTLGPDGAVAARKGEAPVHIAAFANEPRDVTGAGDAAVAGFIFGLLEGADLVEAARLGQAAASLTVAGLGSVSPDLSRARLLSLVSLRMDGS
jgi:pseudouridine kinase